MRLLIDILVATRKVSVEMPHLPIKLHDAEEANVEQQLKDTFGLLYVMAPYMRDVAERRVVAALKEQVRVVLPEYIKGLIPQDFDPEAVPKTVPENW